ncbi:AarF/UbiB family protein [unidentified bacterial endosymbiont]|uniref:AarF/UbiB family protein n=1 Tax=unidentified bacterial endosymbiont TaxID=2355 RepID=UPI0020A1C165|nr:AarF/UbiB family protein [unidentified bacterial endosymbiont]
MISINTLQRVFSADENMAIKAADYKRSTAGVVLEVIVGLLTGGLGFVGVELYHSFNRASKNNEFLALTDALLNAMKNMAPDDNRFSFSYQGSDVHVQQDGLNVKISYAGEEKIIYYKTIAQLRENVKSEILMHSDKCSVATSVMALQDETANQRALALNFLQEKTGVQEFDHVDTPQLVQIAVDFVNDRKNMAETIESLDKSDISARMVLDAESKELLEKWHAAKLNTVTDIIDVNNVPSVDNNRAVQTEDEKKVRKFLAEIFFPENEWEIDTLQPGKRLKNVLLNNKEVLAEVIDKPEMLDAAGLPGGLKEVAKDTLKKLKQILGVYGTEINPNMVEILLQKITDDDFTSLSEAIDVQFVNFKFSSLDGVGMLANIGNVGEGNLQSFVKNVLGNYFDKQAVVDKRAMIASFLNDARSGDSAERKLVGLLKGGGPYLQKMLQLLGDNAPPKLKNALDEMKASLSPINGEIIKSTLSGIVEKSAGKIESIEVGKNLGAASVGQTVLARIKWVGKDEPQEVVIKLLRPGIRLRAERELVFMREEADKIPGMRKTFDGISAQVKVEMDLSKEAHNVRLAQVYNAGQPNLTVMKLVDKIPPSQGYMVLEKAPGTTVKSAFNVLNDLLKQQRLKAETVDFGAKLASAIKALTFKWVEESLFGTGFYHGDLHSGNIMFDETNGLLTVIDMGNATTLSVGQRQAIFKMVMAAGLHNPEVFVRNYEKVLSDDGKRSMENPEIREALLSDTRNIMNTTRDPGKKIFKILDAANKRGLEIPSSVSNFSRSQIMLQNAINNINGINKKIRTKLLNDINAGTHIYFKNFGDVSVTKIKGMLNEKLTALDRSTDEPNLFNTDKLNLNKILGNCNALISGDLESINFSNIIETVGLNHKVDSLGLAYGDIMAIGTSMMRPAVR